jgi:membrane-associated phospholipid phosphatase
MAAPELPRGADDQARTRLMGLELAVGLVLALAAGLLFAWLSDEVAEGETQAADDLLRGMVNQRATPTVTDVMIFASVWGAPRRLAVLAVVAVAVFLARRWYRGALLVAVTLLGAGLLDGGLKLLFGRQRPTPFFEYYPAPETFSFPSGHALFATTFFGGLAALLWKRLRHPALRFAVAIGAVVLILLIGFSRIYLGVHYPSDVLGGFTVGIVWVTAVALGDRIAAHRRGRSPVGE